MPGQRRRHVEQRAFVERRHELRAEPLIDRHRQRDHGDGAGDARATSSAATSAQTGSYSRIRTRLIGCVSSEWIVPTSTALATRASQRGPEREVLHVREQQPHRRVERDRQHRRHDHGEVLGVGQRLEQPAFLRFERQHRQERDGDHQQREEARPADFLHRVDDDAVVVLLAAGPLPLLELLVRLLHDHDRGVHHGADGDGDAAERHDVRASAPSARIGMNAIDDRDRDRDDRDDRARDVPQEDQDDERDDDQLFDQRVLQVVDRAQDQLGAVVGGDHLDARRAAPGSISLSLAFTRSMTSQRVLALAHDDDAGDDVARAVQVGDRRGACRGRASTVPTSRTRTGTPSSLRASTISPMSAVDLRVAAAAHHVLGAGHLDQPAADVVVARAHGLDHLRRSEC